jgi:ATP-dependent protease ClpP protease subunit
MPSWTALLSEVGAAGGVHDITRRKYLAQLHELTNRNVIVYYSGWLEKPELMRHGYAGFPINDSDKNGFMAVIHDLDRSKGLDLLLHTPGGDAAATESLVDYLRAMFGSDIRAIIPQLAMSAGTMISLACKEIVMGKHSSLGPIDPQIGGIPAHGIIEEFNRAKAEIRQNQVNAYVWQPIIAKYTPSIIGECEKAIAWSNEMVADWLIRCMFAGQADAVAKAKIVIDELGDHALTKSHARHIAIDKMRQLGVNVTALEDNQELQEAVMSVHHACTLTLQGTQACKIIENHAGAAFIQSVKMNVTVQSTL